MSELLARELRQFQADEPGFPQIFTRAADEIERLQHDIERHVEIAAGLATENAKLREQLGKANLALTISLRQWRFYANMHTEDPEGGPADIDRDLATEETIEGAEYRTCRAALTDDVSKP